MDIFIGTLIGLCLFKIFKILSKKIQASNKQQNKQNKKNELTTENYGSYPLRVLKSEKYIKADYNTLCTMYNSGIELKYSDYYEIFYFTKLKKNHRYLPQDIYCLSTKEDTKKFSKFLEDEKIRNNESQDGYEYILQKINEYKEKQDQLAKEAFENLQKSLESPKLETTESSDFVSAAYNQKEEEEKTSLNINDLYAPNLNIYKNWECVETCYMNGNK